LEISTKVTVKFYGHSGPRAGELIEEIEAPLGVTVKSVIDIFSRMNPNIWTSQATAATLEDSEHAYVVMVNGVSIEKSKQPTTMVQDGDKITIFLPISGG
jgi:molybdopterin converting factor small subunit